MPKPLIILLVLTGVVAQVDGQAVKSLRLILPANADPVVQNIGRVFERQIRARCDAKVIGQGEAPLTVELAVEPGIGDEGYKLADGPKGTVRVIGNDARGLLYGVGKFLHTSAYGPGGFTPGSWRGVSVPKMPVRGVYFATHFQNYYQVAPIEEVTRYLEELSLWGPNGFLVWFGMEEFNGINDPQAQAMLERLRALLKIVKDLGLDAGLGCIGNDGYRNSPEELRATMVPFCLGVELCPNKPGVLELELQFCQEKFDAFKSIGLDYWFIAPYDNGGCGCARCVPWGINGFLKAAEPEARAFRRAFPNGKVVMSTWYFDHPKLYSGEWAGLTAKFKEKKPDWVDYIMADNFEEYPRYPLEKGVPGGLPMINFPDISMYGQNPWGGYGANPHPGRLQQRWDETQKHLSGGFPYSEGIYEDLNKVICAQLYWAPEKPAIETVKEYTASEFSPEVADDVTSAVKIFERNHLRDKIGESSVTACQLIERADAKLTPQVRSSWRWRLFRIRAAIDQEIYRNSLGQGRNEVFRQACDELTKISHAESVWSVLRPVPIPAINVEGPGLPAGYAEAIAASKPVAWWRMDNFHDRDVEDATEHKNVAVCENGVTLVAPGKLATNADKKPNNRAACFTGGRMKAAIEKLSDSYSVEFWFYNSLPNTARPVTAYLFSRGVQGPEGTPGDNLGISGISAVNIIQPGRLFFFNGDAAKQALGKTELALDAWHHVVLVRDGKRVAVYLNGNSVPEISGEMAKGYPDGVTQFFIGGRNDNFANFQGKIAEASVYDRALTSEEAAGHYKAQASTIWLSEPPTDCPFPQSTEITGIAFTGRYASYNDDNKDLSHMIGDTWYPSWAADGKLYSPWTDGFLNGVKSASWAGEKATTGHAAIVGDDPLHLTFTDTGIHQGSASPYAGRYPCANLIYNGVWYLGTYCLNDSDGDPCSGLNWDILGPFVGFRYSTDYGKTWTDTPHTPERPLFGEPAKVGGTLKLGVPHVVDFGQNMQYSPDGKAYLVGHGAMEPDPKPRAANLSWVTGDQIYMARVLPSPQNINDVTKYEFFAGHDANKNPIWTHDFSKIQPLVDWNNNCGGAAITYNPGLKKYLMCINDGGDTISKMNTYILESDRITGPWKLVVYMHNFGEQAYFANIPSKFISEDGRTAWLCYSANFTNVALPKLPKLKFDPPAGHPVGEAAPMVWQEIKLLPSTEAENRAKVRQDPARSAAQVHAAAVKSLRLVLPPQPSPVVQNIGRVFVRQIEGRCDAKVVREGDAPLMMELTIEPGIGEEGFKIADGPSGTIRIIGNDARGVLYGVGQFLHTSSYVNQGFTPSTWRGVSVPKMPVRGMYLATHMQNYYHVAPIENVTRYIEDLSLWGVNSFLVWFDLEQYNGISDPEAQKHLDRLRALLRIAKDLGLNASLGCIANGGYKNSPADLHADSSTVDHAHYHTRMGPRIYNMGNELCPSKPGVPEMELSYCQEKFDAFKSIGLDYWFIAPYDNGGCTCPQCAPWGANGYLRMAEPMAKAYKKAFPNGKVILSTWYFDRWGIGEWDGISAKFNAQKPDWVDYIMSDNFEEYPRYPLDHGVPGGLALLNFPDISMYGQNPWGGYGANPHPGRLQQRWDETKNKLSGGIPYSEGIYEDINKVICARLWWDPDRPAIETVKDYAAAEFASEVADDVATVVKIFENNHERDKIGESAVQAARLVAQIDAKLTPQAKRSWRWRLFCIRAAIDQEIYRNSLGQGRDKVFRQACEELTEISHAENAWSLMRPVPIPAVNVEGPGLPSSYAEAIAASKPAAWWRMDKFHDRNIADATEHNSGAIFENGVTLLAPSNPATYADKKPNNRAACFTGGRIRATINVLPDSYSVEFWFYNAVPNTARPVTAYILSRGVEGPEPGDNLGIAGTSAVDIIKPGRLFFYNGDAAKQVSGKTELTPETWNHVVLVREGNRIAVHLNGNAVPEVSGTMGKGYPDGVTQLFIGGRNDNFGNLQGKITEASVYDRALTQEEIVRHYKAAGPRKPTANEEQ